MNTVIYFIDKTNNLHWIRFVCNPTQMIELIYFFETNVRHKFPNVYYTY